MKKTYTDRQGQCLAFIYYYSKIHGCAPSEAEMQQYFRVSPPVVHQMILTLEALGLIERTPGKARSIRLLIRVRSCQTWPSLPGGDSKSERQAASGAYARCISLNGYNHSCLFWADLLDRLAEALL